MNRAVILDRDGVINVDKGYVHRMEDFELLPGLIDALGLLPGDFKLIVITNQSGIGRGFYTDKEFQGFTDQVIEYLLERGVRLHGVYYCPHVPADKCSCRKPNPALLERAIEEFHLDPKKCFVIGDDSSDIEMGEALGCHTIFLQREDRGRRARYPTRPEHVACDMMDAVRYILSLEPSGQGRSQGE